MSHATLMVSVHALLDLPTVMNNLYGEIVISSINIMLNNSPFKLCCSRCKRSMWDLNVSKKNLHEYNLSESHDFTLLIYNVALNQPF